MAVRVFYFIMFLRDGLKKDGQWESAAEIRAYAIRGKMRVGDAANDMIVEYLSSITAAIFLVELQGTGAFLFATEATIATSQILFLVAVQLGPEVILDWFVTFIEVWGGLAAVYDAHWSTKTGSYPLDESFYKRQGHLIKAFILKLNTAVAICCYALSVSVK